MKRSKVTDYAALKEVGSNESDFLLAYLPSHSLGYLYN